MTCPELSTIKMATIQEGENKIKKRIKGERRESLSFALSLSMTPRYKRGKKGLVSVLIVWLLISHNCSQNMTTCHYRHHPCFHPPALYFILWAMQSLLFYKNVILLISQSAADSCHRNYWTGHCHFVVISSETMKPSHTKDTCHTHHPTLTVAACFHW